MRGAALALLLAFTVGATQLAAVQPATLLATGVSQTGAAEARHYHFKLTRGAGIPVCDAYLQRLNQMSFVVPPHCGIPEGTSVPGFVVLHRRFLTREQHVRLLEDVVSLIANQPPLHGAVPQPLPPGFLPASWSYDPPIDIENSGAAERVVIWSWDDRRFPSCDTPVGPLGKPAAAHLLGSILTPDGAGIDRAKSVVVFGRTPTPHGEEYVPLGDPVGVFAYRDRIYLYAFFDPDIGDFEGRRRGDSRLADTLGVFERENDRTKQVCEYYVH